MQNEILEIVDENNDIIGKEERTIVYKKGLIHRASHMFIQNSEGKIYIQKRSNKRKTWPNKWDLSAAETLKPGETYEEGAFRGLKEELGINCASMELISKPYLAHYYDEFSNLSPNVFVGLFLGKCDQVIIPDKVEVSEGKFINVEELDKLFTYSSESFTSWFEEDFSKLKKYLF